MHEPFTYKSIEDIIKKTNEAALSFPISQNLESLTQPLNIGDLTVPNRLGIQPMEGCDGTDDGSPTELTMRRYQRFAAGGAGLIWAEATAVVREGRANPRQLMITEKNIDSFKKMAENIRHTAVNDFGRPPVLILQLTHSGRYSRPESLPAPMIACNILVFEKEPLPDDCIVSDEYLKSLPEKYAQSALLAEKAGFDGVDVKACHGYLINELLGAKNRKGMYGGSFENRTRLFSESLRAVKSAVKINVTSRLSLYDGFPSPAGWGADEAGNPDQNEPLHLIKLLHENESMNLLDITIGNPYVNPHVNRPFDRGFYIPPEHPFQGLHRMYDLTAEIKKYFPDITIFASGLSYLRQFSPYIAAGLIESGSADIAGFGRMAFAYPDFAKDILNGNGLSPQKCCITCGKCTELMRADGKAGCPVRDGEFYKCQNN